MSKTATAKKVETETVKPNTVKATFYYCEETFSDLVNKVMHFKNPNITNYYRSKSAMIGYIKRARNITSTLVSVDKDISEILIDSKDDDGITRVTCVFKRPVLKKVVTKRFNLMVLYKEDGPDKFIPLVVKTFPILDYTDTRIRSVQIAIAHYTMDDETVKILKEAEYVKSSVS